MSKYTFICEHYDGGKVTIEQSAEGLSTVLEAFEFFLKGAGFYINGQVDIVPNDDGNDFSYSDKEEEALYDFGAGQPVVSTNSTMFDVQENIELNLTTEGALFQDFTSTGDGVTVTIK